MPIQIVIDTNVLIAALQSNRGASFRLLSLVGASEKFEINVSVPLILEYEEVAKRLRGKSNQTLRTIDDIIDYLCSVANQREIYFLWRPFLKDPQDDMVLELAVEAQSRFIVTFNLKDFEGVEKFGLRAVTPHQFLKRLGETR